MPELSTLFLFTLAAVALAIVPGPAVLYIVARSINQGRLAGIVSMLGIEVGNFFHIAAAALGLSALLLSSALAFNIVKFLGAAYLIYLGIQKLLKQEEMAPTQSLEQDSLGRIFLQGVIVNVLNPKVALFFFAFLPQFINPVQGSVVIQTLVLGTVFVLVASLTDGLYALIAGAIGHWLRGNFRFLQLQRYFSGSVYVGLGVTTAFAGSGKD